MATSKAVIAMMTTILDESSDSDVDDDSDDEYPVLCGLPCLTLAMEREKKEKITNYVEETVPFYNFDDFQRFFRLKRATFEVICQQLGTFNEFLTKPGGRKAVQIPKQLLIFLWHVGGLEPLIRTADRFNVTEFTVLRVRSRICKVVLRYLRQKYIIWPKDGDAQSVVTAFRDKVQFPGVIGALDSTHIQIRPPHDHPQTYVNRKGFHSVILQAVCREDMRYTHVFCGWPGSCHDSRVLKNSDLWDSGLQMCRQNHLIGDGGFPVRRWLMTPYRDNGHLNITQRHYNYCLSSTRQVIERSFSLLKGRFRRLQNIDVINVQTAVEICITCCVFHNVCILEQDVLGDFFNDDGLNVNLPAVALIEMENEGMVKRDNIARALHRH